MATNKKNKNIKCSNLLNDILSTVNGRGGGRPDMAQGSGDIPADVNKFQEDINSILTKSLS